MRPASIAVLFGAAFFASPVMAQQDSPWCASYRDDWTALQQRMHVTSSFDYTEAHATEYAAFGASVPADLCPALHNEVASMVSFVRSSMRMAAIDRPWADYRARMLSIAQQFQPTGNARSRYAAGDDIPEAAWNTIETPRGDEAMPDLGLIAYYDTTSNRSGRYGVFIYNEGLGYVDRNEMAAIRYEQLEGITPHREGDWMWYGDMIRIPASAASADMIALIQSLIVASRTRPD